MQDNAAAQSSSRSLLYEAVAVALLEAVPDERLPELEQLLQAQDEQGLARFFTSNLYAPHTIALRIMS